MSSVLILGAGLVSKPIVDYLLSKEGMEVTVASRTVSKAEKLVGSHPRGRALPLDVQNVDDVEELVKSHDLTVSLVPYAFHVQVAQLCMKHKKNMITTSYISPEMRALDQQARDAGILVLNELGLDPGIDHMSAMKIIHDVENAGGKVVSFTSNCGGLPAPEANTNPWGYKFSWSPRGVVLAGRSGVHTGWARGPLAQWLEVEPDADPSAEPDPAPLPSAACFAGPDRVWVGFADGAVRGFEARDPRRGREDGILGGRILRVAVYPEGVRLAVAAGGAWMIWEGDPPGMIRRGHLPETAHPTASVTRREPVTNRAAQ